MKPNSPNWVKILAENIESGKVKMVPISPDQQITIWRINQQRMRDSTRQIIEDFARELDISGGNNA